MTVHATILPTGTVRLTPQSGTSNAKVNSLPYVERTGIANDVMCLWTYVPDLRRHLAGSLRFDAASEETLRALADWLPPVQGAGYLEPKTYDDERFVRSLFRPEITPYPFQVAGIVFGHKVQRLLLADQVGLGKTLASIGVFLAYIQGHPAARVLVVCPAGLRRQWRDEIHRFAAPRFELAWEGRVQVAEGTAAKRAKLYSDRGWKILVASPETVRQDARLLEPLRFEVVVFDEASRGGNEATKLFAAMCHVAQHGHVRVALTATPLENGLSDLFAICHWLDPRIFPSREYFDERYATWRERSFRVKTRWGQRTMTKREVVAYRNLPEIRQKLRPIYLRRTVEDVGLQLPALVVSWDVVDLGAHQRETYARIRRDMAARAPADPSDPTATATTTLEGSLVALREACNATALVLDPDPSPASAKLERLQTLLTTDLSGERVLVFTDFARFARLLAHGLKSFGATHYTGDMNPTQRAAALDAWRSGKVRVLCMTAAGERGLNLQDGAVVVNADLPWNPARLRQRIGRVRRIGSEHRTVRVINLVANDTVETHLVMRRIYGKRALAEDVFGADELTAADPLEGVTWQQALTS